MLFYFFFCFLGHAHGRVHLHLFCFPASCSFLMFRGAAFSSRLFCLVICVAFPHRSWFPAVHFCAHTSRLVIPALSPVWSSFVLLFMIPPSSVYLSRGFSGPASSLHLSRPLFVFQGKFDFRYRLCFDCLFGKLFNRWSKLDSSRCLLQKLQKVGQVVLLAFPLIFLKGFSYIKL